ncbi:hypothetical protein AB0958_19145 [Streptomyces sp. NPDC006655]|uniref:hypothetical protein n=1 Tax=Streptomyces sp. NPDC006655 TaxID=3156898 RepID=UPI0034566E58
MDPMPPDPSPLAAEQAAALEHGLSVIAANCAAAREMHAVVFDTADGMRADLLARGWSRHTAEGLVFTWTQRSLIALTPVPGEGGNE